MHITFGVEVQRGNGMKNHEICICGDVNLAITVNYKKITNTSGTRYKIPYILFIHLNIVIFK